MQHLVAPPSNIADCHHRCCRAHLHAVGSEPERAARRYTHTRIACDANEFAWPQNTVRILINTTFCSFFGVRWVRASAKDHRLASYLVGDICCVREARDNRRRMTCKCYSRGTTKGYGRITYWNERSRSRSRAHTIAQMFYLVFVRFSSLHFYFYFLFIPLFFVLHFCSSSLCSRMHLFVFPFFLLTVVPRIYTQHTGSKSMQWNLDYEITKNEIILLPSLNSMLLCFAWGPTVKCTIEMV